MIDKEERALMSKLNALSARGGIGREDDCAPAATAQAAMLESAEMAGTKQLDFEAWRAFLRTSCGNQPDVADPSAFAGWVRPMSVCGLDAAELEIEFGFPPAELGRDAYKSERTQRDARLVGADYYYAVFQVAGRSVMTQNDETVELAVGDVALLDAARPAACFAGDSHWLRLQLPRKSLLSHLGCEPRGGLHARGETAAAHLLFDLVRNADKADGSPVLLADSYMQLAVYDLLGALFAPANPLAVSRHAERLFARIHDVIKDGFADPDFGPARGRSRNGDIAALSPETVHGARLDLQRIHLFASFGPRRAPAASPRVAEDKPAPERDRLRLRLSRLHPFRAEIPPSVRLLARRWRRRRNSARRYRRKGATGPRRPASGDLDPARTSDPVVETNQVESRRSADARARVRTWASSATKSGGVDDRPVFAPRSTPGQRAESQIEPGAQARSSPRRSRQATHTGMAQRARR
jgi:AraC family transcriptional regulator, positive regulator of tynA and feaB